MTTTAPRAADRSALLALDEVFAACGARLLREAKLMTGDRTEAEDLLQDAFVRALDRPEVFLDRSVRDVSGWLWLVMRRTWRDRRLRNPANGIFYIRFGPGFGNQITYQWAPG